MSSSHSRRNGAAAGSGGGGGSQDSFSIHELPGLPLTRTDGHGRDPDDMEGSFEFGEEVAQGHSSRGDMHQYTDFDDNQIDFDTSDYFETLEDDYFDALEQSHKKMSSVRFAEKDDLIDDIHRSKNLGHHALEDAALDIFDENVGSGDPYEEGAERYPYVYNDDEESMGEGGMGDEDSMDQDESDEKTIMRGLLFGVGGAAVFAGMGYVAKRVMNTLAASEDVDAGGGEGGGGMYSRGGETTSAADVAQETAHAGDLAAEVSQAALDASFNASLSSSSSSLNTGFAAAGGAQNASGSAAQ
jgi:hypothetical protein